MHMQAEIYQGILAVRTEFESEWSGTCITIFLFLCLTVKIKLNKHFASATLVFFYMGKLTTLNMWQAPNGIMGFYQTAQLLPEHC